MTSALFGRRAPFALAPQDYDGRMRHRTPAYWPTRILLAVGFIATAIALALPLALPTMGSMFGPRPAVLGLPVDTLLAIVGPVTALLGFGWMVRIFRGPRDEAPAWRYRDR